MQKFFYTRKLLIFILILTLLAAVSMIIAEEIEEEKKFKKTETGSVYLWRMETEEELEEFDDDRTGTDFYLESEIVYEGQNSVKILPSGDTNEAKISLILNGERVEIWNQNDSKQIIIDMYFPEGNEITPKMFFMGLADITNKDEFKWIDGVFSNTPTNYGWNEMRFYVSDKMRKLKPDRVYTIYLAFAGMDDAGKKLSLQEAFYIDGIYTGGDWETTRKQLIKRIPEEKKQEIAKLLKMSKNVLLETIQRRTFDFFWYEANPENGLVKDRSTEFSPCSIASVGFGLSAIPVAIERGWITYEKGYERTKITLSTFLEDKVEGINGFYYHFVDMKEGRRVGGCEISSVDTALLIAGAILAGEYFKDTEIDKMADQLYRKVNWKWFTEGGDFLSMGWSPEKGFIPTRWNFYNEGMIANILAIASPTHPIEVESWDKIYRPINNDKYVFLPEEVLFVYQYSHIWINFKNKTDKFVNYFNNSVIATEINRNFSLKHKDLYRSYEDDVWGISASDGPSGYKAYGASEGNHDGTIAPYASIASLPFTSKISLKAIKGMLSKHGSLIWGKYGFVSAFNVDLNWYSREHIGIDEGDILLMIENYRSGMMWKYFMQNKYIKETMDKIGFKKSFSKKAVSKDYLKQYADMTESRKEGKLTAYKLRNPVKIDGDPSDWKDVKKNLINENMNVIASGVERVNARSQVLHVNFAIQWDEENLYILSDVADSVIVSNIKPEDQRSFYRTDSIEYYIDPIKAGSNEGEMKLAIIPFDTDGNVQAIRHEDYDPGPIKENYPDIEVASKKSKNGYVIEVKIPFKHLGLKPESGMDIGFTHTIHNSNNADAKTGEYVRTNILAWNNVPNIWFKPELWSDLILE